jgi:hypothetical protein
MHIINSNSNQGEKTPELAYTIYTTTTEIVHGKFIGEG